MTHRTNTSRSRTIAIAILLALLALAAYSTAIRNEFIVVDDPDYILANPNVHQGLTLESARWAFRSTDLNNWHPLTWLSYMADISLFGVNPGMHHLVNVLFHAANGILLFLVLFRMTGALWRSAFVAALFAVHPLHVESVAWISERKDLLSAFFFLSTLLAYRRYCERPGIKRYLPALLLFATGLLAKPMIVTLPFVLLLLDYWPLRRLRLPAGWETTDVALPQLPLHRLVFEKIPFFALSLASCIVTFKAQGSGATAISSEGSLSLKERIANALVSGSTYVIETFWPVSPAPFRPHPGDTIPAWKIAGAILFLGLISGTVARQVIRRPYLAVGWLWFLGMLVPVIGLIQVGNQAMADRYMYLPIVGLLVGCTWTIPDLSLGSGASRKAVTFGALALLAISAGATWRQTAFWHDSVTLLNRAIAVTPGNWLAESFLGSTLAAEGKPEEAVRHFREAIRFRPDFVDARIGLGNMLAGTGRTAEAIAEYREALAIRPDYPYTLNSLGIALLNRGDLAEAEACFVQAVRIQPDYPGSRNNLGYALAKRGDFQGAIVQYREALRVDPNLSLTHANLAWALERTGNPREADEHYREARRLSAGDVQPRP